MATKNQCQQVLEYMHVHGSITSFEATLKLGITQLATRISELDDMGFPIDRTHWKEIPQAEGPPKRVKDYRLNVPADGLQSDMFETPAGPAGVQGD